MPEWLKECLTKHWRLSWASKSRLGTNPQLGRLAVTAADGGQRPQEKDKLSDKPTVRCRASAGRPTLESEYVCVGRCVCLCVCVHVCVFEDGNGRGGERVEGGYRQQMNLHLCSQASGDVGRDARQTAAEVLRPCGFNPAPPPPPHPPE